MPEAAGYRYAELHLHLGGAILPRVLWSYLQRERTEDPDGDFAQDSQGLVDEFGEYALFERFLTRDCSSLTEYLEAHKRVEPLQKVESLPYYVYRLLRGAAVFENIAYMELRYNPYFRIPKDTPREQVRARMEEVVSTVGAAARNAQRRFPIALTQILCMDSRLPNDLNKEIANLAADMPNEVCAVDLAGPNEPYDARRKDFVAAFEHAKKLGLKTTAHLYETPDGCIPELLPLVDRIGHGIQIALAHRSLLVAIAGRGQCLEVCPTTYLRTGTLKSYADLHPVFERCFDLGVDVAICTDNMAFHDVRLPREHELLLLNRALSFADMERCRKAAFQHAFRWNGKDDDSADI
jgi:adenosine deaminase